tara:strand:- start:347 stop:592 length:246 start_codon:yes stop_codon:yes gene_type:complete
MLNKVITFPLIILIRGYQLIISPILGSNCRFMPTCSEYAIESFKSYGLIKGFFLTIKRIGKCHPWGSHGYDPIPTKKVRNK